MNKHLLSLFLVTILATFNVDAGCDEGIDSEVTDLIYTAKLKNAKANQLGFDSVKDETL
mgnify:CR=1 FL=1